MTDTLQLIVTFETAGARDAVLEAGLACAAATRAESGNLAYTFLVDLEDADRLHVLETWRDEAALASHMGTAHFKAFEAAFDRLVPAGFAGAVTIRKARAVGN